ncbi:MAG: HDIG domain-containing protein [Bacteroidales bacterium]|nr:HDIG domain-containing protein [Bacteroidales bacterium]
MMTADVKAIYDKYYPTGTRARDILERHCRSVASLAIEINDRLGLGLDHETIDRAAMLHDIGICMTDAPGIDCHGTEPYIRHGISGADMLRREGYDEEVARVAERHTGAGINAADIAELKLPLPTDRVLMPETLLERLVCYADKFYSKSGDMQRKSLERVRSSMARHSSATLERFERLHAEFGDKME